MFTARWLSAIALFAALITAPARGQDAAPPAVANTGNPGILSVAVLPYRVLCEGHGAEIVPAVAARTRTELIETRRFQVFEPDRLNPIIQEVRREQGGFMDANHALEIGKDAGVRYVIYGEVNRADCDVQRIENTNKKTVTYSPTATVTLRHYIADVNSGRVWKAVTVTNTASPFTNSDTPPNWAAQGALCRQAAEETVPKFVHQLVPSVTGHVLAVTATGVILDIGSQDGVGVDTDIAFLRMQPIKDRDGNIVNDPRTGQPMGGRSPVMAAIHGDPTRLDAVVGRVSAGALGPTTCECVVGYYHRVFGGRRFEAAKPCLDAVSKGDVVELAARPE